MSENKKVIWNNIVDYILGVTVLVAFGVGGFLYGKCQAYKDNEEARFYYYMMEESDYGDLMEEYYDLQLESLEDYYKASLSSLRQIYELKIQLAEDRGDISQTDIDAYDEITENFGSLENFLDFITRYESYLRTHTFITIDYYYANIWGGN